VCILAKARGRPRRVSSKWHRRLYCRGVPAGRRCGGEWRRRSTGRGPPGNASSPSEQSSSSQESSRGPERGRQCDEWRCAGVPPLCPGSQGIHSLGDALIAICTLTSFPLAQGTPMYEAWESQIKELTAYVHRHTDMVHSSSCSVAQARAQRPCTREAQQATLHAQKQKSRRWQLGTRSPGPRRLRRQPPPKQRRSRSAPSPLGWIDILSAPLLGALWSRNPAPGGRSGDVAPDAQGLTRRDRRTPLAWVAWPSPTIFAV
jgi:hypothetical protein